jgi:hypothetical protein
MSLLLLYARAQAQDHVPSGDLYDLSEYGIPAECRKGIKKVMQTIINSPGLPRRLPKGARKQYRLFCFWAHFICCQQAVTILGLEQGLTPSMSMFFLLGQLTLLLANMRLLCVIILLVI